MQKPIVRLALLSLFTAFVARDALADDLAALAGKWVAEKNEAQGQAFKQVIEIKQSKFTFQALREGGQIALYAEGDVKVEPSGPFKVAKFFNIQGGTSASDLQSVDDDRTVIYSLGNNELTVAENFDKEREQPPAVTKYTKQAVAVTTKTLVIDKVVMQKSPQSSEYYLCLDVTAGETSKRFHVENKAYDNKEGLTIVTDLAIPDVKPGQTCKFVMKLDDVAGDECGEDADNRSTGSLTVTESGSQDFKPEGGWQYAISWHLK